MADELVGQTIELLQTMIRNACVNDGTPTSGEEVRNADVLQQVLEGSGLDVASYDAAPGRRSVVSRIEGSDPDAPSLCLMGHTDVVPVNADGWSRDPFGGELVDGEVWGRGAVDMLNITSSMAVVFRHLADTGFKPKGDLIFFGVADEESGSSYGAQWFADNEPDAIRADYVLTENGGLHSGSAGSPVIGMNVGEKGVAWRKLRVRGVPGHGSRPFRSDNALVKAAAVVNRLAEYSPPARFHELWPGQVETLDIDQETKAILLDPDKIDDYLLAFPNPAIAGHFWSCTHTTLSPNLLEAENRMKTNVIPDAIEINVDVRTLPGDGTDEVQAHLDAALGDLADQVEVEIIMNDPASISRIDTPLWDSLQRATTRSFPSSRIAPQFIVGFTDARVYREMGAVAYGAGLFSPELNAGEFGSRFHGNDERIDVESLSLTTNLWLDVVKDLLG
ncbi:MAG: M20/M25/M40 family metallo-hydrolase [Actinomycetia bacterium]|nr:M20/M25/M40 family metallo-hydrolase [Actinomycetes bacterium]MCP5035397.1 M20/M25/M40 family metallo-hydrolase [Actinomycetes bacterium]